MRTETFKARKFLGIDFTPRKRYRAEIERLERVNADIRRSFAAGEKDRNDLLKKCAEERTFVMPLRPNYKNIGVNAAPAGVSSKNKA